MFTRMILRFRILLLLIILFFAFVSTGVAHAGFIPEPVPLPQINKSSVSVATDLSPIDTPVLMDGAFYFVLDTNPYGPKLWRTDGTAAGAQMVGNLYPGTVNGLISPLVVVDDA